MKISMTWLFWDSNDSVVKVSCLPYMRLKALEKKLLELKGTEMRPENPFGTKSIVKGLKSVHLVLRSTFWY